MDEKTVAANHPVDTGCAIDVPTSDEANNKTSAAITVAAGKKEMKSSKPVKKRSNSLAAKPTGKKLKPSTIAAKKLVKPKTSRDKSPNKKKVVSVKGKKPLKSSKTGLQKQNTETKARSTKKKE